MADPAAQSARVCAIGRRRIGMLHGNRSDGVIRRARWLALPGDGACEAALGYPQWPMSASAFLEHNVKHAGNHIADFEDRAEAVRRDVDAVVCGHVHEAELRVIGDALYCNAGDGVDSRTALVDDYPGQLGIVHWADAPAVLLAEHRLLVHPRGRVEPAPAAGPGACPRACAGGASAVCAG